MKYYSLIIFCLFVQVSAIYAQDSNQNRMLDSLSILDSMLNTRLVNLKGTTFSEKSFSLNQYEGKYIMLVFWSKTCAGCYKEIGDLNRIVSEQSAKDFALISVISEKKEELTLPNMRLRILENSNGFYKFQEKVFSTEFINYEIITEGIKYRKLLKLPEASPIILFIDKSFIVRDYCYSYYVENNRNYLELNSKLIKMISNY